MFSIHLVDDMFVTVAVSLSHSYRDRRKLTFYFIAEKRIDFRELVRELFRLYKTRIWMASLQAPLE